MKAPNILTLSRIALSPVFIFLFIQGTTWGHIGALIVAILFEVTDVLDGWIARRYGQVTDLGKFMDPLADSISRFTVFLCFLHHDYATIWVVALIFWRDSIVSSLRILGATKGVIISARLSGKLKAIVQGTGIITILTFTVWPNILGLGEENLKDLAGTIMTVVAGFTMYSLGDYLYGNRKILAALKE